MFRISILCLFWLLIYFERRAFAVEEKSKIPEQSTCATTLGVAKKPCPPCAKSTWTYLVSDKTEDQAVFVASVKEVQMPHWFGCLQKADSVRTFSPYGSEQIEFNKDWSRNKTQILEEPDLVPTPAPDPAPAPGPPPAPKPPPAPPTPDEIARKEAEELERQAKEKADEDAIREVFDLDVVMLFQTPLACDVQVVRCPSEKTLECKDKLMLAHEDEYRRHCKDTFVNNFEYEIKKGFYDEELAAYWLEFDKDFVRKDEAGNLKVTYDYTTFGCPIEPYQEDEFAPDLRILTAGMNRNTSLGLRYNDSYILIEIFGTKGFLRQADHVDEGYSWTTDTVAPTLCSGKPQTIFELVTLWKNQSSFIPKTRARDPLHILKGFKSCNETAPEKKRPTWKDRRFEIMNNRMTDEKNTTNKIVWNTENKRPETLIFLAIAVGNDTDCPYYTLFGVSLPKPTELDNLESLYWFIFFTLIWLLLVVVGYCWRKAQIRRQFFEEARSERLKQSAWAVIYRYEKLLHESENKQIDQEMTDHYVDNNADTTNQAASSTPTTQPTVDLKKKN